MSDDVSMINEAGQYGRITALCLCTCIMVQHPVYSIIQHLPGCKHLIALYIMEIRDRRDVELLAEVLPQLVQLQSIVYGYSDDDENCPIADTAVVRAAQHLPALRRIELEHITLTGTVTLPLQLEAVTLTVVKPSHFILPSVCQCSQLKRIKLEFITLTDTVTLSSQLQKAELEIVRAAHFILPSLPGCPDLTSLNIESLGTIEECELLATVLPRLPHLQYVRYDDLMSYCGSAGHAAVVSALQHLTQLTHIELGSIDLGDDGSLLVTPHLTQLQRVTLICVSMSGRRWGEFFSSLQDATQLTHIRLHKINLGDACTLLVTPHMTQLQGMKLFRVNMSARRWKEFVSSIFTVQHTVHVTLEYTNIDDDTLKAIHSSSHFTVTEEDLERNEWDDSLRKIEFHAVQ